MKKLIIVVAIVGIAIGANAQKVTTLPKPGGQIIKVDPKKNPSVKTTWVLSVNKLPLNGNYIKDLTSNLKITLEVKHDLNHGKTLYFDSTIPINKVEMFFSPNQSTSSSYDGKTKNSYFYLESSAYKSGLKTGYKLLFYINGVIDPVAEGEAIPLTTFN